MPEQNTPTGGAHGPASGLRIGDAEREEAVRRLGEHFAAGRLDEEEHNERTSAAYAARTQPQLDALFADLPGEQTEDADEAAGAERPCGVPWLPGSGRRGGPGRHGGPPRWLPVALVVAAFAGAGCAISHGKPPIMLLPLLVLAGFLHARSRRAERDRTSR